MPTLLEEIATEVALPEPVTPEVAKVSPFTKPARVVVKVGLAAP